MPSLQTSFTARDYTNLFEWLMTIKATEVPELTDANYSDAGNSIIRLIAHAVDNCEFYVDQAFSESFIATAQFKQSLIDIARTVDLLPTLPVAASTTIRVTRIKAGIGNVKDSNGRPTAAIFIPQHTQCTSTDGTIFTLMTPVNFSETDTYKDVPARQGVWNSLTLYSNSFTVDLNTGRYQYNLGPNVSYDTITMVENGLITWTMVESFWRTFSTDTQYYLDIYADLYNGVADTIWLTLGNGTQGMAPTSGSSYVVSYIQCDGASGNAAPNYVNQIDGSYPNYVSVTNIVLSNGGSGVESIDKYRSRIPMVVRTQRRAVTNDDYTAVILSVPGVASVQVVDRNDDNTHYPWEYVVAYVAPEGGGVMPSILYDAVLNACTSNGTLGDWTGRYLVYSAIEIPVDISLSVGVAIGFYPATVISSVTAAINSFFLVDNMGVYAPFLVSELFKTIMAVPGASWLDFINLVDIQPAIGHRLVVGSISITQAM